MYYDSTLGKLRVYQDGAWVNISDSDGTVLLADGSAAAPSLSFTNSPTTGLFRKAADSLGFAAAGSEIGNFSSTGFRVGALNSAANGVIARNSTTGILLMSGNSTVGAGGEVYLYGASHATRANEIRFSNNNSFTGIVSSAGAWTLGASGSAQNHTVNGAQLAIVSASSTGLQINASTAGSSFIDHRTSAQNWIHGVTGGAYQLSLGSTLGTNTVFAVNSLGAATIGASAGTQTHVVNGAGINLTQSVAGALTSLVIENTDTSAGSQRADILLKVDDASTGSARIRFQTGPVAEQFATVGKDASSSDLFLIQGSGNGFSGSQIAISSAGAVGIGRSVATSGFISSATTNVALRVASVDSGLFNGATQSMVEVGSTSASAFTSSGTSNNFVFRSNIGTGNGSRTTAFLAHFWVTTPVLGTSHTVTRQVYFGGTPTTIATNNAFIADNVSFTGNWFINSTSTNPSLLSGRLNINVSDFSGIALRVSPTSLTSGTDQLAVQVSGTFSSSATSSATGISAAVSTAAASFTVPLLSQFSASNAALGAGSTVTRRVAYYGNTQTGGTNNAFIADNVSFTGNWFINSTSSNPSRFSGNVGIGAAADPDYILRVERTHTGAAASQFGIVSDTTCNTAAVSQMTGVYSRLRLPDAAFIMANSYGFLAATPIKGAAATLSRYSAFYSSTYTGVATNAAMISDNISFTGNWFINSTSTNKSLLTGSLALARFDVASAATIASLDSTRSFVKLTGSTATTVQGIAAGVDGQRLTIVNLTGQNMTISHENGSAAAADRITTMTGADIVTTANGAAELVYDTGSSRWICLYVTA